MMMLTVAREAPAALFYLSGALYGTAAGIVSSTLPEPRDYVPRMLKVRWRCNHECPQRWSELANVVLHSLECHAKVPKMIMMHVQPFLESRGWDHGGAANGAENVNPGDSYEYSMLPVVVRLMLESAMYFAAEMSCMGSKWGRLVV